MTDDRAHVLGRYGPEDPAANQELIEVRLLGFPLQVFQAARAHHDELLREFALLALAPAEALGTHSLPARLVDLIDILGRHYGAATERSDAVRDEALERGDEVVDLIYHLPRSAGESVRRLNALMDEADEFCRSEQLLTLAATEVERDFRDWFLREFERQLDGGAPTRWTGPLLPSP